MELWKKTELKIRKVNNQLLTTSTSCCCLSYCIPGSMLCYNVGFFQTFFVPGSTEKRALNSTHSDYFIASFSVSSTWNIIYSCKCNGLRAVQYEEWVRSWYKFYFKNMVRFLLQLQKCVKISAYLCFCKDLLPAIYGSKSKISRDC